MTEQQAAVGRADRRVAVGTQGAHVVRMSAVGPSAPDGSRLATASKDGTARLWEVQTSRRWRPSSRSTRRRSWVWRSARTAAGWRPPAGTGRRGCGTRTPAFAAGTRRHRGRVCRGLQPGRQSAGNGRLGPDGAAVGRARRSSPAGADRAFVMGDGRGLQSYWRPPGQRQRRPDGTTVERAHRHGSAGTQGAYFYGRRCSLQSGRKPPEHLGFDAAGRHLALTTGRPLPEAAPAAPSHGPRQTDGCSSPDGRRLALLDGSVVRMVDISRPEPTSWPPAAGRARPTPSGTSTRPSAFGASARPRLRPSTSAGPAACPDS